MGLEQEELTGSAVRLGFIGWTCWWLRREHGLILNFAKPTLETQRVIASQRPLHDFVAS